MCAGGKGGKCDMRMHPQLNLVSKCAALDRAAKSLAVATDLCVDDLALYKAAACADAGSLCGKLPRPPSVFVGFGACGDVALRERDVVFEDHGGFRAASDLGVKQSATASDVDIFKDTAKDFGVFGKMNALNVWMKATQCALLVEVCCGLGGLEVLLCLGRCCFRRQRCLG